MPPTRKLIVRGTVVPTNFVRAGGVMVLSVSLLATAPKGLAADAERPGADPTRRQL